MSREILKYGLIGAGITTSWILVVVTIIFNGEKWFGARVPEDNLLIPVVMLHVFVISAAITGFGVFGRPVMWYLDGRKKEALKLLAATLTTLIVFAIIFLSVML